VRRRRLYRRRSPSAPLNISVRAAETRLQVTGSMLARSAGNGFVSALVCISIEAAWKPLLSSGCQLKKGLLSFGVAPVCAVGVGIEQFPDGEAVSRPLG
jgi:hypothetical protein